MQIMLCCLLYASYKIFLFTFEKVSLETIHIFHIYFTIPAYLVCVLLMLLTQCFGINGAKPL